MRKRLAGMLAWLALGLLVAVLMLSVFGATTVAQGPDGISIYYVAPSCLGIPTPCYAEVQAAVDDVDDPGDVVQIAQGTYSAVHLRNGTTQAVHLTKTLTIRGGYALDFGVWDPDAYPTIVNAQSLGRVFYIAGEGSPVIEGLTLTGGDSGTGGGSGGGGGILAIGDAGPALTVTLRDSRVVSNTAGTGFGGAA